MGTAQAVKSRARRWLALASATGLAVGVCCRSESNSDAPGAAGTAGDASGAAGQAGGAAGKGAAAGSGGAAGTAGTGASAGAGGRWMPGDADWRPIGWLPEETCDLEVADNPEAAAPPLVWQPCDGISGCQRLVVTWEPYGRVGVPTVTKSDGDLRVVMSISPNNQPEPEPQLTAMYDGEMTPLVVWRITLAADACDINFVKWTEQHVCMKVFNVYSTPPYYANAFLDPSNPASTTALEIIETVAPAGLDCNTELLVGTNLAPTYHVTDLTTYVENQIKVPGEPVAPLLTGPNVLFLRWGANAQGDILDGWIWKRPNTVEQLIDPGTDMIYDLRSDGQTLVWLQVPADSIYDQIAGGLWTSPFATTPGSLQPVRRIDVPPVTITTSFKAIGGGYYALIELPPDSEDRTLHLYRLSDMRHWTIPTPEVEWPWETSSSGPHPTRPGEIVHLDAEEIWFMLTTTTNNATVSIQRQRLDALGPGN